MEHRNITTSKWTRMAIDSLLERGTLPDWREFATALKNDDGTLAKETLFMSERHDDKGAAALARILVEYFHPELTVESVAEAIAPYTVDSRTHTPDPRYRSAFRDLVDKKKAM